MRYFLTSVAALALMTGTALAQARQAIETPVPTMPVFTAPTPGGPPPSTTQRTIDSSGNQVDTTQTYRTGPFGTYTDQTTITTAPPGNPSAGTSTAH
jgi:hypothetical protein